MYVCVGGVGGLRGWVVASTLVIVELTVAVMVVNLVVEHKYIK